MTHGALHVSAIALGVAAFVSISPLSTASADSSAPSGATPSLSEPAPTPSVTTSPSSGTASAPTAATPSLSEPAPTPSLATSPPSGTTPTQSGATPLLSELAPTPSLATAPQRPSHITVGHYARHTHYAWRNGHRYAYYSY